VEGQKQGALAAAFSLLRFSPRWAGAPVGEEMPERERVAVTARESPAGGKVRDRLNLSEKWD